MISPVSNHPSTAIHSRLRKLVRGTSSRICGPVKIVPQLDNWVHRSGRVIVLGEATRTLPVCEPSATHATVRLSEGRGQNNQQPTPNDNNKRVVVFLCGSGI